MPSEITVVVKDDEKRLTKKHLIYEAYQVSEDDPIIKDCIESTIKDFKDEPTDVQIKITMSVR